MTVVNPAIYVRAFEPMCFTCRRRAQIAEGRTRLPSGVGAGTGGGHTQGQSGAQLWRLADRVAKAVNINSPMVLVTALPAVQGCVGERV